MGDRANLWNAWNEWLSGERGGAPPDLAPVWREAEALESALREVRSKRYQGSEVRRIVDTVLGPELRPGRSDCCGASVAYEWTEAGAPEAARCDECDAVCGVVR